MPEPDFEQIARDVPIMSCEACAAGLRRIADGMHYDDAKGGATWGVCRTVVAESRIAEQLRLVWNARGAADVVKLDAELSLLMGGKAAGPYVKNLDRALRTLDR